MIPSMMVTYTQNGRDEEVKMKLNGLVLTNLMNAFFDVVTFTHRTLTHTHATDITGAFFCHDTTLWNTIKTHLSSICDSWKAIWQSIVSIAHQLHCVCVCANGDQKQNSDKFMWINLKWIEENSIELVSWSHRSVDDSKQHLPFAHSVKAWSSLIPFFSSFLLRR